MILTPGLHRYLKEQDESNALGLLREKDLLQLLVQSSRLMEIGTQMKELQRLIWHQARSSGLLMQDLLNENIILQLTTIILTQNMMNT